MAETLLALRLVHRGGSKVAVDERGEQWDAISAQDFPDERCGICGQYVDEGYCSLMNRFKLFPPVVCKRHIVMNGEKVVKKYRSIDE